MLEAIGGWPGASWLQQSATAYLFVNAAHILGLAVLLGAILPLDLRLLGLFRRFPLEVLGPFLVRCAAAGLGLALLTGRGCSPSSPRNISRTRHFDGNSCC